MSVIYIIINLTDVIIGFLDTSYSVFENESQVIIQVGLLEGSLQREVTVTLSTSDLTAVGKYLCYNHNEKLPDVLYIPT